MAPSTTSRPLTTILSSLSIRTPKSRVHANTSRLGQIRTQATSRRTTKRLRATPGSSAPKPHPSATSHLSPFSRPINPAASSITFTPPPSAPTPYHTPSIFLPPNDPRRVTLAPVHRVENPYAADKSRMLPPPVRHQYEKKYNLDKGQIDQMRELRLKDPVRWTRAALAKEFGCTEFFVGIAAPSTEGRREWHRESRERASENWGAKRRKARDERVKRRELWAKDA